MWRAWIILVVMCSAWDRPVAAQETPLPKELKPYFRPPVKYQNDLGNYRSPLLFQNGKRVSTKAEWRKRRQEILKTWHKHMGQWPKIIKSPKIQYLDKERRGNITQHHVRIEIAPGRMTDDAYLLVPDGKGPFPAVVVVYYDAKTGIGRGKVGLRDFAYQLAKRGFVTLSLGSAPETYYPNKKSPLQPLSFHAYVAVNCYQLLAGLPFVDALRIGIVGHSYGGKWALFAACLFEQFSCAAWSDPGIVFDEKRSNVNYWDRWYLGHEPGKVRPRGRPSKKNPRTGPYKTLVEKGHDLHELHALMAPRPFLVSGGAEDRPERWKALNHTIAVNKLLGFPNRVGMTNRKGHGPTEKSNEQIYKFFEHFLKPKTARIAKQSNVDGCDPTCFLSPAQGKRKAIPIGSRLELMVDDYLISRTTGSAKLHLHKPTPKEVVLTTSHPWEGNTCAYFTIFQDGDIYRMYYRGSHYDVKTKRAAHREVTCYAESKDGIHWKKPKLGLFEFNGSKDNNIVWDGIGTHNFTPFKDLNPKAPKNSRYKALGRGRPRGKRGLYAFQSADGIHWKLMYKEPVITQGAFDSQNLAFWDPHAKLYREYHRTFRGVRDIQTGTSHDFLKWTKPVFLKYPGAAREHLYTNAVRPYPRAPHILIGFPTRYQPKRGSQVEPIFMTSRDGVTFRQWKEPVIPVTAPKDRDGNRSNYMTWGLVQLPEKPKEYSVYATEAYYTGPDSRVRRFTYRVDGFVSLRASKKVGEMITKKISFGGKNLRLNFTTKKKGSIRVEIQDGKSGKPIPGYALKDCMPIKGDALEQIVSWRGGKNVQHLAGRSVRLRFVLRDADLYSFRFR